MANVRFLMGVWVAMTAVLAGGRGVEAAEAGQKVASAEAFELVTPGLALRFLPERAWTFSQITYQGQVIGIPRGFYGLVLATGPAKFIGSGHDEGGVEVMTSAEVKVDGQPRTDVGGTIPCTQATVTKRSRVGDFEQVTVVYLYADRIELESRVTAERDTFVELMYPFMFCWSPTTTEWLAQLDSGDKVEGRFSSDNGWELEKDARWTAIYEPAMQLAMVCEFADDLPPGELHKHGYWDRGHYHKQYYQSLFRKNVPQGQVYVYRMTLHAVSAAPDQWKQRVAERMSE